MTVTVISEAQSATNTMTSVGEVTISNGENVLDIHQWMALKMHSSTQRKIQKGFIYVKDESEEVKALEGFKNHLCELLFVDGYSLVKKNLESNDYKDYERVFVEEWLARKDDAAIENKESREIDSLRIAKSSKNIALFSAVAACVAIVISVVGLFI